MRHGVFLASSYYLGGLSRKKWHVARSSYLYAHVPGEAKKTVPFSIIQATRQKQTSKHQISRSHVWRLRDKDGAVFVLFVAIQCSLSSERRTCPSNSPRLRSCFPSTSDKPLFNPCSRKHGFLNGTCSQNLHRGSSHRCGCLIHRQSLDQPC